MHAENTTNILWMPLPTTSDLAEQRLGFFWDAMFSKVSDVVVLLEGLTSNFLVD